MFGKKENVNLAIPKEYRVVAGRLFSVEKKVKDAAVDNARAFSRALGVSSDYIKIFEKSKENDNLNSVLTSFQNNIDLLIQKTWVEQSDEIRKDDLQQLILTFIGNMENKNYRQALKEFGAIIEELAYLFFGIQSCEEDFVEYIFRIDDQVGLFWWYGSMLNSQQGLDWVQGTEDNILLIMLLLGICYLTNF